MADRVREAEDQMDAAEAIIQQLVTDGFERDDLPGPGDLRAAIEELGYTIGVAEDG